MNKPGFLVFHEDVDALSFLDGADFKAMFMALNRFSRDGEVPAQGTLTPSAQIAFNLLSSKIIRDAERYQKLCDKRNSGMNNGATSGERQKPAANASNLTVAEQ